MSDHFSKSLKIEEAKVEYLPPEILIDILLRLPIKSIITWTSVSKSWNSLIKSLYFISTHLNRTIHSYNHNQTHLLLLRKVGESAWFRKAKYVEEVYSLHWDNEAFDEYTIFDFPFHGRQSKRVFRVVGTCNGLVCLANYSNFFVWNPCIRKYVTLSATNIVWNPYISEYVTGADMLDTCIGFGFDSKTNDYKVVTVGILVDKGDEGESTPVVHVYSLATGEWKMVTAVPPRCAVRQRGPQAFVNGALHWAVFRSTKNMFHNFVLVFDLGDEDFREIMLPKDLLTKDHSFDLSVSVCGESLAAFCSMCSVSCIHVWVMKEYGVLESWTRLLTVGTVRPYDVGVDVQVLRTLDLSRLKYAVGFRKSGEVVIEMKSGKLVSIDYESKKITDLRIPGHGFTFVDPYVESLALLDKSKGAVSY